MHLENGALRTEIIDDAAPFDPTIDAPEPELDASVEARAVGGLGVLPLKRFTDSMQYTRLNDHKGLTPIGRRKTNTSGVRQLMDIKDTLEDDIVILHPAGRLDSSSSREFEQFMLERIADRNRLIVDFSNLDYISSAGLRVLLAGAKQIHAANGRMLLCGMKGEIQHIFEISGFVKILKVKKNLSKAKQEILR